MNILFVCSGNVGRSQMASILFEAAAHGRHHARSAGTDVFEKEGQTLGSLAVANEVLAVLDEIGVDARARTRTQVTEAMVSDADVVVSMAPREEMSLYLQNREGLIEWNVEDPFKQSRDFTRDVRVRLEALVEELLSRLP